MWVLTTTGGMLNGPLRDLRMTWQLDIRGLLWLLSLLASLSVTTERGAFSLSAIFYCYYK